jgi:RNA polymerase sigma factor for flagellar operon FliA
VASNETLSRGLALIERPAKIEASLWRRLRYENDDACRRAIFERHLNFARRVARREWRRWPAQGLERGDFEQLACGALLEAIDRYDPKRRTPFEAFALSRLRGAIADGARRASEAGARGAAKRRLISERARMLAKDAKSADPIADLADLAAALAIGLIAENAIRRDDGRPDLGGYETRRWRELELNVLEEIAKLRDNERLVIERHYIKGEPFARIAESLDISPGRVSQLHRAALNRLRQRLRRTE